MEKRLRLVFFLFLILFVLISLRLFHWQIASSEDLKGFAQSQTNSEVKVEAKRGQIYTSDNSPLVINQPAYLIYAEPEKIKNPKNVSETLATLLNVDQATISAHIEDKNLKWVALADKVDDSQTEKIKTEGISGIGYSATEKRYYPEASMAAQLLGFVGKDQNGEDQGYFGLEGYYDQQLRGRDGYINQEKDALGNPILAGSRLVLPEEDGRNLYLTIDKTVQYIVESKLKDALTKYGASAGSVIVMDPSSGKIIAMSSFPSYDPEKREEFPSDTYKNPAVSSSYEPGSTFKILIMAAALNEDKIKADGDYDETGPIEMGKYAIKTWNNQYHGKVKIPDILKYSSNVGMVYIADKLGKDNLYKYLKNLGVGELTGIDLQDESTPQLRPQANWYDIDYATASFGQGIAVTPLQMIRMAASIANGGQLFKPFVVDHITDPSGETVYIKPEIVKRVFKKETASIVTEMMVNAVEGGETKYLKPIGVRIAGKTGTAQIPISGHYDTEKTIASFIGFFPAQKPKLIMLVTLREPTSSPWGSETAAPLFFQIAKELVSYYNIPVNY